MSSATPLLDARLDHNTLVTGELKKVRAFLQDVIGLRSGVRPPFGFPGFWLYARGLTQLLKGIRPC